jgi:adenylosuccinate synthase
VVTKVDSLVGLGDPQIASAYELEGQRIVCVPASTHKLEQVKPVYEPAAGWTAPARGARSWEQLPAEARTYLDRLSELIEVPVTYAGTGPSRLALAHRER